MTEYAVGLINARWPLVMPAHRCAFHDEKPWWESSRLAVCADVMQPGMTVYDIGAEHGDFTALYRSWVGDTGAVVPFEPSPPYWPCIRETYEANDFAPPPAWWAGFAGPVTMQPERPTIDARERDGWPVCAWGENSDEDIGRFRHLAQQIHETPTTRIDQFAVAHDLLPDAVVIDVEGAEYEVLNGMTGLFVNGVLPYVFVSVHDVGAWSPLGGWYDRCAADLDDLMGKHGYARTELEKLGEGERFYYYHHPDR